MGQVLTDTGRVALVGYRAEDITVPMKPLHRMSVAQCDREYEASEHPSFYERSLKSQPGGAGSTTVSHTLAASKRSTSSVPTSCSPQSVM